MSFLPDWFEPNVPPWRRFRAEGRTFAESLWNARSYLRKYRRKKLTAPAEEIAYFNRQRLLLSTLPSPEFVNGAISLAAVGDLMWIRDSWDSFLSPAVLGHLNRHDVVVGNLETPLSRRHPVPSFWPDYLAYNSDPRLLTSFRRPDGRSTFTVLSTTNNHTLDRGDEGMLDTLDLLRELGVLQSGVRAEKEERPYAVFTAGGLKFGFLGVGWGLNAPAKLKASKLDLNVQLGLVPDVRPDLDLSELRRHLADMAADGVDLKIVFFHWGYEFELYPCPKLMRVGRELVAAGADIILGSHPHVVQPLEVLFVNGYEPGTGPTETAACRIEDGTGRPRKALIAYSLGNFTTAMYTLLCELGLILSLKIGRRAGGEVDWSLAGLELVRNVRRDAETNGRRLTLLPPTLAPVEDAELRAAADFLANHVTGAGWPMRLVR